MKKLVPIFFMLACGAIVWTAWDLMADTIGVKEKTIAEVQPIYDKWDVVFRPMIPMQ